MSYDIMFQQALSLHQQGQLDAAEQIYRQILETAPEHPDILNFLGLIAQEKGVHEQAVELFYRAIKKAPEHAPFYFNLGLSLNALGKPVEALENLRKAAELSPDTKEIYNKIGLIEHSLDHINAAQQAFLQALQLDMNYSEAKANLAATYINSDQPKAIRFLTEIAAQYPDETMAPYLLSSIYFENGDYVNAIKFAQQAEKNAPYSSDVKFITGLIELKSGNAQDAEVHFAEAVNLDNKNVDALVNLANAETNRQDFENAEKHYKRAIELQPQNADAHLNYANLLYYTNRINEALEEYRAVVINNPNSSEACNNIGVILKDLKDYDNALGLFFNAYGLSPQRTEYAVNIAETLTLLHREDPESAIVIAENWLKIAPDDAFARQINAAFKGEKLDDTKVYSEKLFDNFADNYELVLERIAYSVPERIKNLAGNVEGTIVDLGCGSGLVGKALKTQQNKIIGIDISQKMLDKAAQKNVYDKLIKADILEYCRQNLAGDAPNAVIATDVFGYIGNLAPLLNSLRGYKLYFSVEHTTDSEDYKLNDAGRYQYNPQYVENLLKENGFNQIDKQEIILRKEAGQDVNGLLYFARP